MPLGLVVRILPTSMCWSVFSLWMVKANVAALALLGTVESSEMLSV